VAAQDTLLGGDPIPAGTEILLELSGNHITAPACPETSSLSGQPLRDRPSPYGLVFGSGIHRCLGAKLAELEASVIVQETATALPGIQLRDREPEWIRLLSFQAPRTVTVTDRPG
jgi:cytochrome P450